MTHNMTLALTQYMTHNMTQYMTCCFHHKCMKLNQSIPDILTGGQHNCQLSQRHGPKSQGSHRDLLWSLETFHGGMGRQGGVAPREGPLHVP